MFTDLHYSIAKELIFCASKNKLISYKELCNRVGYGGIRKIGIYLDPISKFTYFHYGIFISSIVVRSGTTKNGHGFINMYRTITGDRKSAENEIATVQREKVFKQDWSALLDEMKQTEQICANRNGSMYYKNNPN